MGATKRSVYQDVSPGTSGCLAHGLRDPIAMKRRAESELRPLGRPVHRSRRRPPNAMLMHAYPLLVHPLPQSRDEILVIAAHLARRAASRLGKSAPEFSENAAAFLASRSWTVNHLAARIARAVAANQDSLIIGADLADPPTSGAKLRERRR